MSIREGETQPLLTTAELAAYLQVPVTTLHRWRHDGTGPDAMRVGRHLRYEPQDVDRWLEGQKKPVQNGRKGAMQT